MLPPNHRLQTRLFQRLLTGIAHHFNKLLTIWNSPALPACDEHSRPAICGVRATLPIITSSRRTCMYRYDAALRLKSQGRGAPADNVCQFATVVYTARMFPDALCSQCASSVAMRQQLAF
jgi:hypothetical protein